MFQPRDRYSVFLSRTRAVAAGEEVRSEGFEALPGKLDGERDGQDAGHGHLEHIAPTTRIYVSVSGNGDTD